MSCSRPWSGRAEQAQAPATLRSLLEYYVVDLERQRKGPDTVVRAVSTAKAVERVTPELLDKPVSSIGDGDVFAFARAREQDGAKPSTINRDLRTLRAALKQARPEYRFPGKAFFPADDTRVRWLRPEEEILVLEPMPSPFREMAKLAALTLMRQGEIRVLRPEYVRLEQGAVLLPRAKGGHGEPPERARGLDAERHLRVQGEHGGGDVQHLRGRRRRDRLAPVARPTRGRPESLVQCSRKRRRCHRRTVSGATMTRSPRHPVHILDSHAQKSRSLLRSFGRVAVLLYTASWWCNARFSSASWRWPPQRTGRSRSRWNRRVTIEPRFSPDQRRQINHLAPNGVLAKDRVGYQLDAE